MITLGDFYVPRINCYKSPEIQYIIRRNVKFISDLNLIVS